ncbi:MAG: hypothetical protein V7618_00855 [Rhodoglobus sp.]|uniref:hypothetical protein n=1 Tax=uncultured Salinibacterium sp. TaxID=459274 RepID=UPI0030DB5CEF|tara:strand:- start:5 stop:307 length:303 start_codon:yes stop_codon:yes gene_type:complete
MINYTLMVAAGTEIFAAGSSDDDSGGLGLVFLLSGFAFYTVIYLRYRNVDKRHRHEAETEAVLLNLEEQDVFVASKKGLTNSRMSGANSTKVHGALRKFF